MGLTPEERELLLDLVDWCRDFFEGGDGAWGCEAADALARHINYTEVERRTRELALEGQL